MFFEVLILFFVLCLTKAGKCPLKELESGCVCDSQLESRAFVACEEVSDVAGALKNLSRQLKSFPNKRKYEFDLLQLRDLEITELDADFFGGLSFKRVDMRNCRRLAVIHPEAFSGSEGRLRHLAIINSNLTNTEAEPTLNFDAFGKLRKLEKLVIVGHNFAQIPDLAFSNHQSLQKILITGLSDHQVSPLWRVGAQAFFNTTGLTDLDLSHNVVRQVSDLAMCFNNRKPVKVRLSDNQLAADSFKLTTFLCGPFCNRINLYLDRNYRLTWLPETAFHRFFRSGRARNSRNVYFGGQFINISCEWAWFYLKYEDRKFNLFGYGADGVDSKIALSQLSREDFESC